MAEILGEDIGKKVYPNGGPMSTGNSKTTELKISTIVADNFDHKTWINEALKATSTNPNPEDSLPDLILSLQTLLDRKNSETEDIFHEVTQSLPRFIREVESLRQQAIVLTDHLAKVEIDFQKGNIYDSETIQQLIQLDRDRNCTKRAAEALEEADRWAVLVSTRNILMEGEDVEQLYQHILDMEQCIAYLEDMPDLQDRLILLDSTKDRLETLLGPQFMELLDLLAPLDESVLEKFDETGILENLQKFISIFAAIGRGNVTTNYYISWFSSRVSSKWNQCLQPAIQISIGEKIAFVASAEIFFKSLVEMLRDQSRLKIFHDNQPALQLCSLMTSLKSVSHEISQFIDSADTSLDKKVELLTGYIEITRSFASDLCDLFLTGTDLQYSNFSESVKASCYDVIRIVLNPLSRLTAIYNELVRLKYDKFIESVNLISSHEESELLINLQNCSESSILLAEEFLHHCLSEMLGVTLPTLLTATEHFFEILSAKWTEALNKFASDLIRVDATAGYAQSNGLGSFLLLVAATGNHSLQLSQVLDDFRSASEKLVQWPSASTDSVIFPLHTLFVALLGQTQPAPAWNALSLLAPNLNIFLKPGATIPHMPSSLNNTTSCSYNFSHLKNIGIASCRSAMKEAHRVAIAPVNDILSKVPSLLVWSSIPGSGESRLPDIAYLPQEYITQMGQYIFNLPEQLLPFMEFSLETECSVNEQGCKGLFECLRVSFAKSSLLESTHSGTKRRIRQLTEGSACSMSSSSSQDVVSPVTHQQNSLLTSWLDQLLSGEVSSALIKSIIEISDSSRKFDSSSIIPRLTEHGAKQLDTDLGYFLGLLEELSLPTPPDLIFLRELINCPAVSFTDFSKDKPSHLVSAVITLRNL